MHKLLAIIVSVSLLAACGGIKGDADTSYPISVEDERELRRGKLTGDGLVLFGGGDEGEGSGGGSGIGVNSFLWRATLDTLSFMPLASADPFGGVIITDWYEDPKTPGERFKVNVLILGKALRSDGLRVSLFKQKLAGDNWRDEMTQKSLERELEDTILTRARQLRVAQAK